MPCLWFTWDSHFFFGYFLLSQTRETNFLFSMVRGLFLFSRHLFFFVLFFLPSYPCFYFERRAVLAGCFWVIALVLYGLDIFLPEPSDSIIVDYTKCVASHPQITPTSCSREYESVDFNLLVDFLFVFLFLLLLVISFLTNDQMVGWWKDLIFRKCFSKYEQLEGENL